MTEPNMNYFYEIYEPLPRGGPGNNECTRKAFEMIKGLPKNPKILDVGCGPGMQTMELMRLAKSNVIALDNYKPFLDKLKKEAAAAGLAQYIETTEQDMAKMSFSPGTFDLIWSEGALYCAGFENGLKQCHKLLKPGGYLAASELVWLTGNPSPTARTWCQDYTDIKDIRQNLELFKKNGYEMTGHFTLPVSCWLVDYYAPLQERLIEMREKYKDNKEALDVIAASQTEIDDFKKCSNEVGYEFFVAKRV